MKALKTALLAAGVLALIAFAVWRIPVLRLSALVALGRSPECPFAQAIQASDNLKQQIALKDRILRASKRVEVDAEGYTLWDTPHGRYWVPKGSDYVLPFNLAEQERRIYGSGPRGVREGDVVLDCGANVGVFVRVALESGAKLVIAIEPGPENIECLNRNFRREIDARRVVVYPKGVWDKEELLELHVDPHNSAANSFVIRREGSQATQKLPLTTIDKLVAELQLERVDFIKMDIEGAEVKALHGARQTLARFRPRLALSAYHVPEHPRQIPIAVRQGWDGYRMECGVCAEENLSVRPDVQFFY